MVRSFVVTVNSCHVSLSEPCGGVVVHLLWLQLRLSHPI